MHQTLPQRVRFASGGRGESQDALTELGAGRVMVIASRGQRVRRGSDPGRRARRTLVRGGRDACPGRGRRAGPRRRRRTRRRPLLSVGGGSATGLAKAVALTTGLPIVAVPTTYAGSEATTVWGLTEAGRRPPAPTPGCCPATVVYDATLTLSAAGRPQRRLGAQRARPLRGLDVGAAGRPDERGARRRGDPGPAPSACPQLSTTQPGSMAASTPFTARTFRRSRSHRPGSGLHHKICHVLGGMFDLPHAPDARRGAAACAGVQRTERACGRAAHRRGVRRAERA